MPTNDPDAARSASPYEPAEMLEAMLRAATEHAIIGTDAEGTVVVFNTGAERLLGYRADEVVGRVTAMRFHDLDEVRARAAEQGVSPGADVFDPARGAPAETRQWTYLRKDGTRVPVALSVSPVLDAHGHRQGFVGIARDLTAEQQAEAERARAAERFLRIFEAAPLPVLVTRAADGLVVAANPAFEDLAGWAPEELLGRTVLDLQLWPNPTKRAPMVAQGSGGTLDHEETLRTRYGDLRRVEVAVEALDVGGEDGLLCIFQDVTDRHDLDEALRLSEARLRAVLDGAPAVISLKDLDGRYLLVNRWFEESFGRRSADVVGLGVEDVHPPEVADRIRALDEAVAASGTETTLEQVLAHADGSRRTYLSLKFVLRQPDGEAYAVCTISTDVTGLKAVEAALRDSEARFRELADNIDEVFLLATFDPMVVLYVSPAFDRVLGIDRRRFVEDPATFLEAVHPEDRLRVAAVTTTAPGPDAEVELEYRVRWPDGTERWARHRTWPVAAAPPGASPPAAVPAGARHWITTITDITEQKHAELAVRQALADAERANRAKSEFLSRVSHELRTPLNAILGFGQLLELDELDPDRQESVDQILKAGRHLLTLIDEILEIARTESGQLRLSLEPIDLAALLGEALDMFRPLTAEQGLGLTARPEPGSWGWALADQQRLKQVVLNLLSNAVKYNRPGGRVEVAVDLADPATVRATVRDTGIGIPPEDVDRVFAPFERLGPDAAGEEGAGLGLALSKGLVEAMGGTLGVASSVGEGTAFTVELRRAPAPSGHLDVPDADEPGPPLPVTARTVLYVEDNLSNVRLVERLVGRRPGVQLLTAMQGRMALDLAAQHHLDLVLLDVDLPDVSGEEVLRRLKADEATAATPVVIVSADAQARQVSRLLALGAADYLTKPIDLDRFYAVLDDVLAG